ncbi:MAG: Uncharacterised protein [Gammaproteobacteria bacterium]|nr:MAG: Uncharacterised protein [Gammaproteobacteria bacterium]
MNKKLISGILGSLIVASHVVAEPEPMMTKGDLCAYLALSSRQQEGFLSWAAEKKQEDFSHDPLYLEALIYEIDVAERKKAHYESLMEYSRCDSDNRWGEKLVPNPI